MKDTTISIRREQYVLDWFDSKNLCALHIQFEIQEFQKKIWVKFRKRVLDDHFVNGWDEARNFAGVPCEHQPRTIAADLAASRHPTIWTWVPPEELFRRKVVPAKPTSPWDLFAQAAETVHPTMRNVVTVAKAADVMPGVFQEFIYGNREFVKKYQVQYER